MKFSLYQINYDQCTWHRWLYNDANKTVSINNGKFLLPQAGEGNVSSCVCLSVHDGAPVHPTGSTPLGQGPT